MIRVDVTIGIGMWKVHKTVNLVACPHTGDGIDVDGITVMCERVYIMKDRVIVNETVRFSSESDLDEYVKLDWTK